MSEYLIQDGTGNIYISNPVLSARQDMNPYEWPTKDEAPKTKRKKKSETQGGK